VKGHKEDTILAWLRDAAEHAAALEAELLARYRIERGQLDSLWAYVGNKGEKKGIRRLPKAANSGAPQGGCHASAAKHLSGRVDQGRASPQVGRAQGQFANCPC
jgi:hypothetical protein